MTYAESIAYLDSLAQFGWKLDLARIERLCELAGHPERQFRSVLVGGSAGKGSTCAFLTSILTSAGFRVGSSPKPHLFTHRERVQIDQVPISEERFAFRMAQVVPLARQVTSEEGAPTVFEVMTLLAFLEFAAAGIDWAVVEVGLGGRFDATNVLLPEIAVIVSIGLDHTDRLGETVEEIAFEKAGIIKPGGRVVTGAAGGALAVIEDAAASRGAQIRRLGSEIRAEIGIDRIRASSQGGEFALRVPGVALPDLEIPLAGEHQIRNAALAAASALWLHEDRRAEIPESALRSGLRRTAIPGRLQTVRREPLVLVDAAHSPDRAAALAQSLRTLYLPTRSGGRVILVIGCSRGHDPAAVVACLAPLADQVIATRSRHPASVPAAEIVAAANTDSGVQALAIEPVGAAVHEALSLAQPEDTVVVTGSLFVVAEALEACS